MNVKERSNWTNKQITYLKNCNIAEYDLASGGLSVIKQFKLLKPEYIEKLDKMEKEKKNITIGKLQAKIPDLAKHMVEGFGEARQMFINKNNISDDEILSIKKDAIFIINHQNINGKVSNFLNFRQKNIYSSYVRLNNNEFYFSPTSNELDVKGISEEYKEKQKNYLLRDIYKILKQSEKLSIDQLFINLKKYRSDYLDKNLSIETYRNLDTGLFLIDNFELDTADDNYIDHIDISYNYINYILPLIKIVLE